MKQIAVLASGSKDGGGSGFEVLAQASIRGSLGAEISCVLSNHEQGGVWARAEKLGIRFEHFEAPWTPERFWNLVGDDVDLICMSGWLKQLKGLPADRTINIHPGPLPDFGGPGMYGHHVHEAVMEAYRRGEVEYSAVTMHFVTDNYDEGPVFFEHLVKIREDDTPETLGARVNAMEHRYQWQATKGVLDGYFYWDGVNPSSLCAGAEFCPR